MENGLGVIARMGYMEKTPAGHATDIRLLLKAFIQLGLEQKLIILCVASIFMTAYVAGVVCGVTGAHIFNQKKNQDGVYTFSRFFMGLYFLRSRSCRFFADA